MPIRVVCTHCGKQFSAWDDLLGKAVKCPKCQQQMIVNSGNDALDQAPNPSKPPVPSQPGTVAPPVSRPTPGPQIPASGASSTSASSYPIDDLDDSEDLPYACPHCHQAMPADDDLCDKCGYHRVLQRRIDVSEGIDKPDKTVGFERFFKGQLDDADSAESTLLMIKVVGGLIGLVFFFVCHPWSWLVVIGGGIGYFFYRKQQRSAGAAAPDSTLNQDGLSKALWAIVLTVQRAAGWRVVAWPFPATKVLTLHDPSFTDNDLNDVENLQSYNTLDLEGTQVSDVGLQKLATLKQLQFVVVRRTNVTVPGVQRLQQTLPHVSIWF